MALPSANHLCSWAGVAPRNNESAGKRLSGRTTKGNKELKSTLVQCAHSAVMVKSSFFYAQYQRLSVRRGKKRAIVAVAHSMLIAIYHLLKNGEMLTDLGADYYNQFNKERKVNALLRKLHLLGWKLPAAMALSFLVPLLHRLFALFSRCFVIGFKEKCAASFGSMPKPRTASAHWRIILLSGRSGASCPPHPCGYRGYCAAMR